MELLIASALAAILMIGILFAITQLAKQTQRLGTISSPTQFNKMVERLRQDLIQATACRVTENKIYLQGFMLLDRQTHRPTQQPAEVIYRLVRIGDEHWLMRHQRALNNQTLNDTDANLLGKGIISMQLTGLELSSDEESAGDTALAQSVKTSPNNQSGRGATQSGATPQDSPIAFQKPPSSEMPPEISDQWAPLPPVVQWTLTLPNREDQTSIDTPVENIRTYTLVLQ